MRIVIDNKLYYKPINLSSNTFKLIKIHRKLFNILSKVCPWALTLGMFVGLAVLGLRCF